MNTAPADVRNAPAMNGQLHTPEIDSSELRIRRPSSSKYAEMPTTKHREIKPATTFFCGNGLDLNKFANRSCAPD